jgi:hypothetical protein
MFRAEERSATNPIAPYGDTLYKAQQRAATAQAEFDAVAFRAEEHAAMTPLAPYNDTLYNAQRRARTDGPPTSSGGGRGIQAK